MSNRPSIRLFNTYQPVVPIYYDLIQEWVKHRGEVNVVISKAVYRQGRDRNWSDTGLRITNTPSFGLTPTSGWRRLVIMLVYMMTAMLTSLFGPHADINLFLTQPPMFYVWGYFLYALRKQSYYILLMDVYPDVAVQDGMMSSKSIGFRVFHKLSRFGLKRATGIFVIGRCMKDRLMQEGIEEVRIHLVNNWVDTTVLKPVEHSVNDLRKEFGLVDKFVLLYSGNAGVSHYFDDLLEVALRTSHLEDLRYVFIGGGSRLTAIKDFVLQHDLKNVRFFPFQSQDQLAYSLSVGNVHFVSLRAGFEGLVVPSKSYGAWAVGRPIIYQGHSDGEIARLIQENDVGEVVDLGDVDGLLNVILDYYNDRGKSVRQGDNAYDLSQSEFTSSVSAQRLISVLLTECEDSTEAARAA